MSRMRKVMKLLFRTKMLHRKGMQLANNVMKISKNTGTISV